MLLISSSLMKKYGPLFISFLLGVAIVNSINIILAHEGNSNNIHACVKNSNGDIRIISPNDTCASNETATDWQQFPIPGTDFPLIISGGNFGDLGSRMSNKNFQNSIITATSFNQTDLSESDFSNSITPNNTFIGVNLSNAVFINNDDFSQEFTDSNLSGINLQDSNVTITFQNVNAVNANFSDVTFNSSQITNSDLTGSNFTGANTAGISVWQNTLCPDGSNSDNNGNTCEGHLTP